MDKRDRFIAEIAAMAKLRGLTMAVRKDRGKGGHALVFVGDRFSTLPSRDIDPKTAARILKALGLR
ncbi:hypothetical protein [Alsobacter sp. SYSU BS001988]|jgi:hypothetical protein